MKISGALRSSNDSDPSEKSLPESNPLIRSKKGDSSSLSDVALPEELGSLSPITGTPDPASIVRIPESSVDLEKLESIVSSEIQRDRYTLPPLSVVIPVYNEHLTIQSIVDKVRSLPIEKQIIIVDDGSTDGTREILAKLALEPGIDVFLHAENQGKGAALQTGFRMADGDVIIVQDADLEYDPNDIMKVIQPILDGRASVVYGSRYLAEDQQDGSKIHRFGNAALTWLSNRLNGQNITDMETCYKAFRRDLLRKITIYQKRFGFEPEMTAKIARLHIPIIEVPISYRARSWKEGKKIGVKDLFNAIYCIVRYALFR